MTLPAHNCKRQYMTTQEAILLKLAFFYVSLMSEDTFEKRKLLKSLLWVQWVAFLAYSLALAL